MAENVNVSPDPTTLDEKSTKSGAAVARPVLPRYDSKQTKSGAARAGYAGRQQKPYAGEVPQVQTTAPAPIKVSGETTPPRMIIEKK